MQSSQGLERKLEDLLSATFHRYFAHCTLALYNNSFLPPLVSSLMTQVDKFASRDETRRKTQKADGIRSTDDDDSVFSCDV